MTDSTLQGNPARHLHPLSLVFELASILKVNVIPTVIAILWTSRGGWIGATIGTAVLCFAFVIAIIRFLTFQYRIVGGDLIVDSGLIHRLHRTVPLSRIQNIDLSQNVFHRILRVGELRVETASGKEPEAKMRVISIKEYERLRSDLQLYRDTGKAETANASDADSSLVAPHTQSPELVLALPLRLVIWGGFLSNRGEVIAGLIFGFFVQQRFGGTSYSGGNWDKESIRTNNPVHFVTEMIEFLMSWLGVAKNGKDNLHSVLGTVLLILSPLLLLLILRTFSAVWYLLRFYGYRMERVGETVHVRCGLLTQVSATIPINRIQFISVQQRWLARLFGLASIRIETAGGGKKVDDAATSIGRKWFVPVVQLTEVQRVLAALDPRLEGFEDNIQWQPLSSGTKSRMFRSTLILVALLTVAVCIWSIPIGLLLGAFCSAVGWIYVGKKAKSRRYGRTPWGLVYRSGTLERKCSMTFFEKLQSVTVKQSPFDRRWHMATLAVDTAAAGPANHRIEVEYLDSEHAVEELRDIIQASDCVC